MLTDRYGNPFPYADSFEAIISPASASGDGYGDGFNGDMYRGSGRGDGFMREGDWEISLDDVG